MAAVGAWPVPWATYGRRGGVAGPQGPVWPPMGRGRSPGPRVAGVGAWPVPWDPFGRRGGVAGSLGPVRPPWGRGWSPGPRTAAVGAWPVPWAPYGRRGIMAGPQHEGAKHPSDIINRNQNHRRINFSGDKPTAQFERGTQIGGKYPCGSCGCKAERIDNLAYSLHCSWKSYKDLQSFVLSGIHYM